MLYGFKENKCKDEVYSKNETEKKFFQKTVEVTTAGTDLNEYKTEGKYFFNSANRPLNAPVTGINGWLEVMQRNTDNTTAIKQIWYTYGTKNYSDTESYIRTFLADGWSNWIKVMTTRDFVVLTGSITLPTSGESVQNVDISYPTDYNKDNCVVISTMLVAKEGSDSNGYNIGSTFLPADVARGSGAAVTALRTDSIRIYVRNIYISTGENPSIVNMENKELKYKLVLMKIPSVDISGLS